MRNEEEWGELNPHITYDGLNPLQSTSIYVRLRINEQSLKEVNGEPALLASLA
jgi:hypothetical protein